MNLKEEVLHRLRESGGYLSGEELSRLLGVSRTAIWKNINALREAGYEIESSTNRGYRLLASPDVLTAEEISAGLTTRILAQTIYRYESIDSTNQEAKRQALRGAPNGSLFLAEEQTGGKGRLGRGWSSPAGEGLWFSLLLRPEFLPEQVTLLTLLAGLSVCGAIRCQTGCPAMIKWPNDIVIGSRKVCGILTEMSAEMDRVEYVVLGIGINVNTQSFPDEIQSKATSLRMETGKAASRAALLREILAELEQRIQAARAGETNSLLEEYKQLCVSLNRQVGFTRKGQAMTGTAVDITPDGELLVRCGEELIPVFSGEVTVQGIYEEK